MSTIITPQEAQIELVRLRALEGSFYHFCLLASQHGLPARHHRVLIDKLQQVMDGKIARLAVFMPPGHGKSVYTSQLFPAHYLNATKGNTIILASNIVNLAEDFGQKIRRIYESNNFRSFFGTKLDPQTRAIGHWFTKDQGEFFAAGVGGAIAGRRSTISIIDDPIRSHEEADSLTMRNKAWNWYTADLRSRRKDDSSAIILIQCMVGDTKVLMADGSERPLRDLCVGDEIATYEDEKLGVSIIEKWGNQGEDDIFEIKTQSGGRTRANARHPFLIERGNHRVWVKLKDLRIGDIVVRSTGHGKEFLALNRVAKGRLGVRDTAARIITKSDGPLAFAPPPTTQPHLTQPDCGIDTELPLKTIGPLMPSKRVSAPFAKSHQVRTCAPTGAASSALTMITKQERSEGFSVTIATLQSDTERMKPRCEPPLDISDFTLDRIIGITSCGRADVFDIQVSRTENFIADGFVSHNTRWSDDDLAGRIFGEDYRGASGKISAVDGEVWDVISLPALAEAGDYLNRPAGEALWPEQFSQKALEQERITAGPRKWAALYQQRPAPEEGNFFRREWIRYYDKLPSEIRYYGASDYAVTSRGGDYTVHGVVGLDNQDNIYLVDLWRGQTESLEWIKIFLDLVKRYKPLEWAEEKGQIQKSLDPIIRKRMNETRTYCYRKQYTSSVDKQSRAQAIQARMSMGKFLFPRQASWLEVLETELLTFPAAKNDDMVDTMSLFGRMLDRMVGKRDPQAHPEPKFKMLKDTTYEELWKYTPQRRVTGRV